jgi:hypothetical protein
MGSILTPIHNLQELQMRTTLIIALAIAFSIMTAIAGNPKKYGKGVKLTSTTKISSILENPRNFKGKTVRVEGTVVDVCKKRGCWMEIASDKEFESIRIKVDDGVIVFPLDAKGKTAVAEGTVSVTELTMEETIEAKRHEAEEQGVKFDEKSVKEPIVNIRIKGTGAEIK